MEVPSPSGSRGGVPVGVWGPSPHKLDIIQTVCKNAFLRRFVAESVLHLSPTTPAKKLFGSA